MNKQEAKLLQRANKVAKDTSIGMNFVKSCATHGISYKRFTKQGVRLGKRFAKYIANTNEFILTL